MAGGAWASAAFDSVIAGAAATACGGGIAGAVLAGASGSESLAAAASGGAMKDLAGISDVVDAAAGAPIAAREASLVGSDRAAGAGGEAEGGPGSSAATALDLSVAAVAVVEGAGAGSDALFCETVGDGAAMGGALPSVAVGGSAPGCEEGIAAAGVEEDGFEFEAEGVEAEGGDKGAAALCRTIDPVTESRPCSRTVTRE
jgi:hypothetical protein